ncbi:MAG: LPS assembly lipoprotein LptE [Pseudomonadota bacterium]|uniref:LPS-assembly lipoprotein LptE n=1 Tax=Methylophaga aminisulfidivorans TaxID=230105 RepID=UPI0024E1B0BE|nr:LPS assembly lipoprotein LptE [Methylophaga aminisulfidivorans]MEC9412006.1 LPS assembly lipoprotein LptE [Pseudomonadota bacterium]
MNRVLMSLMTGILMLTLTACGFHLRGEANVPESLKTIYIQGLNIRQDSFGLQLKRALTRNGIQVLDTYKEGAAVMTVVENVFDQNVLSVGSDAKVTEYELETRFSFKVSSPSGEPMSDVITVQARRDYQFDRNQLLAMSEQQQVIRDDLNKQMVQNVLRRLSALK